MKAIVAILFLLCAGLAVALLLRHQEAVKVQQKAELQSLELTNLNQQMIEAQRQRDEREKVARALEEMLNATKQDLSSVSNKLISTSNDLARLLMEKKAAEEAAKVEIEKRDAQINQLTQQTNAYAIKMDELTVAINNLGKQIAETERKLAAAEGDREFLLKELKRLQAEKAELEKQFNDLKLLRVQIARLKEELSIQRRLDWIRSGLYGAAGQKGAERLLAATPLSVRTNYGLNVELRQDGTATVAPSAPTNAPRATNPPAAPPK